MAKKASGLATSCAFIVFAAAANAASVEFTQMAQRPSAEAVAAGVPQDMVIAMYFVTTDADILSVNQVVANLSGGQFFQVAPPFGSDTEPPDPLFISLNRALEADSWISTPGATSKLGGGTGFPGDGTGIWGDLTNDGPKASFKFATLTRPVSVSGTFMGRISVAGATGPEVFPFSFVLPDMPINLGFNAPIANTIADGASLGTGFTHRLPGTGSEIPASDPNLDLSTSPGKLRLTSTLAHFDHSQFAPRRNLPSLDAPGVQVLNVGSQDVSITGVFEDVTLPGASDELSLYAGVDANTILRAGFAAGNAYRLVVNTGNGDTTLLTSSPNAFAAGDDVTLTLSRVAGDWTLQWDNHTAGTMGSLAPASLPWLESTTNLYVGVHASHAPFATPFVGLLDQFAVGIGPQASTNVPEPAAQILLVLSFFVIRLKQLNLGRSGH